MSEPSGVASIWLTSGVNEKRRGFVTIEVTLRDGSVHRGQLSVEETRGHGLRAIEAAEAADSDAALVRLLEGLDVPLETWSNLLLDLRKHRDDRL